LLMVCTIISLALANSAVSVHYLALWEIQVGGLTVKHWINDALMAIYFLLIGLELERELNSGELSDFNNALLPVIAAVGGMCLPAWIHFMFNSGTATQIGIGIPMATDIAFSLGILALLGRGIPASLKVFLAAVAVIDDLGAIIVIAVFYTASLTLACIAGAILVFALMMVLNRFFGVMSLFPYLLGGGLMWFLMLKSGVHPTMAGVLLAFAIPYSAREDDAESPSHRLEHYLNRPVAFGVLPMFALANTGIVIGADWSQDLLSLNSAGIISGLFLGKPLGITLFSAAAVAMGICRLPLDLTWRHILGAGLLCGVGFTMSIFITNLAFVGDAEMINAAKMSIVLASLMAGTAGILWLKVFSAPGDQDTDTMEFQTVEISKQKDPDKPPA